jgi:hypothetical protein
MKRGRSGVTYTQENEDSGFAHSLTGDAAKVKEKRPASAFPEGKPRKMTRKTPMKQIGVPKGDMIWGDPGQAGGKAPEKVSRKPQGTGQQARSAKRASPSAPKPKQEKKKGFFARNAEKNRKAGKGSALDNYDRIMKNVGG